MRELDSSLSGFFFSVADESIERMDKQTLLVLRAGVQSVSSVDKQMKPHEYTCSWIGGVPTNYTSGESNGYWLPYLNCSVKPSPA
mgnify:CR=1 FL=1